MFFFYFCIFFNLYFFSTNFFNFSFTGWRSIKMYCLNYNISLTIEFKSNTKFYITNIFFFGTNMLCYKDMETYTNTMGWQKGYTLFFFKNFIKTFLLNIKKIIPNLVCCSFYSKPFFLSSYVKVFNTFLCLGLVF